MWWHNVSIFFELAIATLYLILKQCSAYIYKIKNHLEFYKYYELSIVLAIVLVMLLMFTLAQDLREYLNRCACMHVTT